MPFFQQQPERLPEGAPSSSSETVGWFLLPTGPAVLTKLSPPSRSLELREATPPSSYVQQVRAFQEHVYPRLQARWGMHPKSPAAWVVRWLPPAPPSRWASSWSVDSGSSGIVVTIPLAALLDRETTPRGGFSWILHELLVCKLLARLVRSHGSAAFTHTEYRENFATLWQAWVLCIALQTSPVPQALPRTPIGWRTAFLLQLLKEEPNLLSHLYEALLAPKGYLHLYDNPEGLFSSVLGPISLTSRWKVFLKEHMDQPGLLMAPPAVQPLQLAASFQGKS